MNKVNEWKLYYADDVYDMLNEQMRLRESEPLIWLDPIDLEIPYRAYSNVVLQFLIRVESCFSPKEISRTSIKGVFCNETSFEKFLRLVTDFVLGFCGNIQERQNELDPDTFVIELLRAINSERKVIELGNCLQEVLILLSQYNRAKPAYRKFVLPILNIDYIERYENNVSEWLSIMKDWPVIMLAFQKKDPLESKYALEYFESE